MVSSTDDPHGARGQPLHNSSSVLASFTRSPIPKLQARGQTLHNFSSVQAFFTRHPVPKLHARGRPLHNSSSVLARHSILRTIQKMFIDDWWPTKCPKTLRCTITMSTGCVCKGMKDTCFKVRRSLDIFNHAHLLSQQPFFVGSFLWRIL